MSVLVVAVSARMLAELAVGDGYDVIALDRFGDVDLRAIAPAETAPSSDGLVALAANIDADAVVYGAGLESLGQADSPLCRRVPQPGPGELLVRVDACGICFSDIKILNLGGSHPRLCRSCLPARPSSTS